MAAHLLGVDTGGTFTDFVYLSQYTFRVHKVLSTPSNPALAISKGIQDLDLGDIVKSGNLLVIHGTTVATNVALQGRGVETAYITNRGIADVLRIGRQTRSKLYDLRASKVEPPIKQSLTFEVDARLDANGNEVTALNESQLTQLKKAVELRKPDSIAINLLFSFLNDEHEKRIEALFDEAFFVSRSSYVLPEYKEYERGITTWVNAWIGPLIKDYMLAVERLLAPSPISIMQSSGTTIAADQAAKRAVNILLSGPAGGLSAARLFQTRNIITFDMGGTSTDVSLISDGIRLTNDNIVGEFPIAVPMADIHTIGAGGGSIAYIDGGGLLQVGPHSAGANPGPACYGLGGREATVTDANLVLGRLRPEAFLGGTMILNRQLAVDALAPIAAKFSLSVEDAALGILRVANEHMCQALRHISIQRGFNPNDFTLVCFGGAGGLHLCALAEAIKINRAMLPVMSGVLSALGMIATNPGREMARTHRKDMHQLTEQELQSLFSALLKKGSAELKAEGVSRVDHTFSLDLRYVGQAFTINVPFTNILSCEESFHKLHYRQYGHSLSAPVELLNVRVHIEGKRAPLKIPPLQASQEGESTELIDLPDIGQQVPVFERESLCANQKLEGPSLIVDRYATSLVLEGWQLEVDEVGNILLLRN